MTEEFNQRLEEIVETMLSKEKGIKRSKPKHLIEAKLKKLEREANIKTEPYGIRIYSIGKKSVTYQVINARNDMGEEFFEKLKENVSNLGLGIEYRKYKYGGFTTWGYCEFYGVYQGRKPNKLFRFMKTLGASLIHPREEYLLSVEPRKESRGNIFDLVFGSEEDLITLKRKEKAYESLNHILKRVYKKNLTC